ncbi:MAG TPA: hypothetical protein VNT57_07540, partial [Desulfobacteria bacterium]|nr:hypothetical protein [Desulfobacteria bacterium]
RELKVRRGIFLEFLRALAGNLEDFRVLLFFYWVESCMIAFTGLGLMGIRVPVRNLVSIGILHGVAVFLVRGFYSSMGIRFGTHTLVLVLILSSMITKFTQLSWGIGLSASLLGMVTLILGESLVLPNFHKMLNMTVDQIWENPWTHVLAGYVGDILLVIVTLIVALTNFSLVRIKD